MDYEVEIEKKIHAGLIHAFGIKEEVRLQEYLLARYLLLSGDAEKTWSYEMRVSYLGFILGQLGISALTYQGERMSLASGCENSLMSILESWAFRQELSSGITPNKALALSREKMKDFRRAARKKSKRYRNHPEYGSVMQEKTMDEMNECYGATIGAPCPIEGFSFNPQRVPEELSLHTRNRMIFNEKTRLVDISERELEDYVAKNLEKIEPGLSFFSRQTILEHGVIDILARDNTGRYVVIELKVEDDKDLLWQRQYYVEEIEKMHGKGNVRFLAVAPSFHPTTVKYMKETELFIFHPITKGGKLMEIRFFSK